MRLVLIGPPGAGKGTHCKKLADKYSLNHLASGDIFRAEIAEGTELGKTAQEYIGVGQLVPDDIVIKMMIAAIKKAGNCILDGFPRTVNQAKELDKALEQSDSKIDAVIELKVDDEIVAKRITQRRVCLNCGATYHLVYFKPAVAGVCDSCGDKLVHRQDDKEDLISKRLIAYHKQTEPIVDYYRDSGKKLLQIDAAGSVDKVFKMLVQGIDNI